MTAPGKPFDGFKLPMRNDEAMALGMRGLRHKPLPVADVIDQDNPCDGWRPLGERFDDYEPSFDSWAYDPDDLAGYTRRPTSEWDDPSWVACEFSVAEFERLRAIDESNRSNTVNKAGNKARSTRGGGCVYYAERGGLIKIGCSKQVKVRMCALGASLLATEPGGYAIEHERHAQFAADRDHGEWFRPSPALLNHIASLVDRSSLAVAS